MYIQVIPEQKVDREIIKGVEKILDLDGLVVCGILNLLREITPRFYEEFLEHTTRKEVGIEVMGEPEIASRAVAALGRSTTYSHYKTIT